MITCNLAAKERLKLSLTLLTDSRFVFQKVTGKINHGKLLLMYLWIEEREKKNEVEGCTLD